MKTHLKGALESAQIADANLTGALFAAIKDGDKFASILITEMLGDARKLSQRLAQALDAANASNEELARLRASNAASRALHEEKQERALSALDEAFGGEAGQ